MKKQKIGNVIKGLALIALAVCILLTKANIIDNIPILKLAICLIMGAAFIDEALKKHFLGMAIPLGVIACLFRTELGLATVAYWIIIVTFVLIGLGLNLIFGKKPHINMIKDDNGNTVIGGGAEYTEDVDSFDLDNSFGAKTQYVNIKNLRRGNIDNAMGQLTVYLDNSTIAPEGAHLDIDNGLGQLKIYMPKEFRVVFDFENGLGKINVHGECSQDESLPVVHASVDNGLGETDIYFE